MNTRFYDFGPFRIDAINHVLLRDGKAVPLKPKAFDTLLVLVQNRTRVLDKDELMRRLWPDTIVEEANLSQNIYLLRKVLDEEPQGESYIETMPKRGYRFVATVRELEPESPELISGKAASGRAIVQDEQGQQVESRTARPVSTSSVSGAAQGQKSYTPP